jgi:hypothetical protein
MRTMESLGFKYELRANRNYLTTGERWRETFITFGSIFRPSSLLLH